MRRSASSATTNQAICNVKGTSLGPVRAQLIRNGMVFSPAQGGMSFTVSGMDE
jgi:hypothetical protein